MKGKNIGKIKLTKMGYIYESLQPWPFSLDRSILSRVCLDHDEYGADNVP